MTSDERRSRVYAVTPGGPVRLPLRPGATGIHDALDEQPLGIYEGLRTFEGRRFLRLERHLDRADRSLAAAGLGATVDRDALRLALDRVAREWPHGDARIRFDVLAESARDAEPATRTLLAIEPLPPLPPGALDDGVRVGASGLLHRRRPTIKEARWVVDRRELEVGDGLYEHVLLDGDERVLECTSANVFFVRDGELVTAEDGVLVGVTRGIVLELARAAGVATRFEALPLDAVSGCSEAFLTSASRGLVPIVAVGPHRVGRGRPGPVFRELRGAYEKLAAREARPALPA